MAGKTALRSKLKQARLGLSDAERIRGTRAIVKQLKKLVDWSEVKTVHYFEPIRRLQEVDISDLAVYLEDNYPSVQLFTPRLIDGAWQMVSIKDKPAPEQFDVILVPALGFDPKTLHRIGYGGGYYDKFLATQPQARKIGVCFESGKHQGIPIEPHDVPVNLIVTEARTYTKDL